MSTTSTDQLEHDLRTMLRDRAATITTDVAAGEAVIADRLRAGDDALAEVVPLVARRSRRWLIAAAAVAVLIAGVAAVIARDDEVTLVTPTPPTGEPVIFTGPGTAEDVARAYLADRLDASASAIQLEPDDSIGAADAAGYEWTRTDVDQPTGGFVGLLERDGSWAVLEAFSDGPSIDTVERDADSITVHTTGPAGSHVQLSVHRLSGESLTAGGCGGAAVGPGAVEEPTEPVRCSLVDEPIPDAVADEPLTVRFSVVTQDGVLLTLEEQLLLAPADEAPTTTVGEAAAIPDSPAIGAPGDSAKDVAERLTREVFGSEYVTVSAQDFDGLTEVTLEGEGNVLVATVVFDEEYEAEKLIELHHPDTKFEPRFDGGLYVVTPTAGELTVTVYDGNPGVDLSTAEVVVETRIDGPGTDHGPFDITDLSFTPFWLRMDLVTDDGQVLRYFGSVGG